MNLRVSLSLLFIVLITSMRAGELPKGALPKTILLSGKITDTVNNETLAGVKIICENCTKTIYSDLEGRFFIYLEVTDENLTLEFSQVGYQSKTLNLKELQANSSDLWIDLKSE
jgi:CarboxypepD_reg-like domain